MSRLLKNIRPHNYSGITLGGKAVKTIKKHSFHIIDEPVGGDAPKDMVRIYLPSTNIKKDNKNTWPKYIVKLGQKWYPNESITEQLLSEIGQTIGINMASSLLLEIEGVLRFCSRHFHSKNYSLVHGADIISSYKDTIVLEANLAKQQKKKIEIDLGFEDIIEALNHVFENNKDALISDFIQMLLFDCFVGNNDRHYFNWGVIISMKNRDKPKFSPIYDTARALFWNKSDDFIREIYSNKSKRKRVIEEYIHNSKPVITLNSGVLCNHFELVEYLSKNNHISQLNKNFWLHDKLENQTHNLLDVNYRKLMIPERIEIIKEVLSLRLEELQRILKI